MITLASHKTFADKMKSSQATAALFLYSDKKQAKEFYYPTVRGFSKANYRFKSIQMNDVQPGRNRGNALPSTAGVMEIIKFFTLNHEREIVVCDIRGKGLAIAAAIICRFINHGAGRKALEEVLYIRERAKANGFVLRLADSLINSNLAAAAQSYGDSAYTPFTPSAYRLEAEESKKDQVETSEESQPATKPDQDDGAELEVEAVEGT